MEKTPTEKNTVKKTVMRVEELLFRHAARRPNHTALVCGRDRVEHHAAAWGIDENDRFLVTTPLAHRAGVGRLVNALGLGGTLVIMEKFDPLPAL